MSRFTQPGEIITRNGGTQPTSEYFSPPGVTVSQRNLLPGTDESIREAWRVLKPWEVMDSPIAGPDGFPTGGIQSRSTIPFGGLTKPGNEYIEPIEADPSFWQQVEEITLTYWESE